MKKNIFAFILVIIITIPVFSHYKWVIISGDKIPDQSKSNFRISCGHKFPDSEILLRRDMIIDVELIVSGRKIPLEIFRSKKSWEGEAALNKESGNMIVFKLKKKISKNPFFWGKALVLPEKHKENGWKIVTGEGLEIIPEDLSGKKVSDNLKFRIILNGTPVVSKLSVIPEGKKTVYLTHGSDDYYTLKLKYSGQYMAYTFYKGKGASLTFNIRKSIN